MKITPKTTSYVIVIAIVYGILLAFTTSLKMFEYMPMAYTGRLILKVIMEITYLNIILYLYYMLKYINEERRITTSFLIYISFNIFDFLFRSLIAYPMNLSFSY